MIKLYGSGGSRWVKPYWTLRELDAPFEPVNISIMKGEARKPEYLALNPFAKVPALVDGDFCLFDSTAICRYLVDKFPEKGLAPKAGSHDRARMDQWISFATSDLEQPLWRITRHKFVYPEAQRSPAEIQLAKSDYKTLVTVLEKQIEGDYLVGGKFSLADIVMAYTLSWSRMQRIMDEDLIADFPRLKKYLETQLARPKYPKELYA